MDLYARNQRFYDSLWRGARLRMPRAFATWSVVEEAAAGARRLLEVGPGVRPRLPLASATFLDLSGEAARRLRAAGARALRGRLPVLPFPAASFDFISALDVVEHAGEPLPVFRELARVLAPGGRLLFSTPVHARAWSRFDAVVGHSFRLDPDDLGRFVEASGMEVEASAPFGALPRSRLLVGIGAWVLERFPRAAIRFEDRLVLPLVRLFARAPRLRPGLQVPARAGGVLVLCRRQPGEPRPPAAGEGPASSIL